MRRFPFVVLALLLLLWYSSHRTRVVTGQVVDEGPVAFASVRLRGQSEAIRTDRNGTFKLPTRANTGRITATKTGYRISWADISNRPLEIKLTKLPEEDNVDYSWIDPSADARKPLACGNCHEEISREWASSAHARSATNPRVLALFGGPKSPLGKDWNLLEQHPLGVGVCAACHAPTLSSPQLDYDLRAVSGVAAKGVHCDFCHKIAGADADKLGTRFGRDGYRLLRPTSGEQLFFGPLPDAVRPGEAFVHAPFYKESRYCASCHDGIVFGVHVYGTYSEWLESPARKKGLECQSCHMAPTGNLTNMAPGKGGIERDPQTLASHGLPGSTLEMLKRCLEMQVTAATSGKETTVEVSLTANHVGHRVPTGFIDRHLVLVVATEDSAGRSVGHTAGPALPRWAGANVSGKAGVLYAKVLEDDTGRTPLPFWLPYEKMTDTRLTPGQTDRQVFSFPSARRVRVRLLYRRLWPHVAEAIGGNDNEIVLFDCRLES